ncbi:MAG: MFS transporter, partial [Gemmatimonadaceae bacterium]|nr:MFS transporter [Acetobacteraceae bacterium]
DAAFAAAGRALGAAARPAITGITLLGGFASTLGWPMGTAMVGEYGWRLTLVAYAAIALCVNLPLYLALVPAVAAPGPVIAIGPDAPATEDPRTFRLMVSFFTVRAAIATVISVIAPALLAGLGLSVAQAVAFAALIGPAQVGARLLQATIGRALSPLAATWIGAGLLPVAAAALFGTVLLPGVPVQVGALVFVLGYGLSNGLLTISRGVLPLYLFGAGGYAARIGRIALPVLLAQAAAPTVVAATVIGWPAHWVVLALGAVSALAAACLIPLRRPRMGPGPP